MPDSIYLDNQGQRRLTRRAGRDARVPRSDASEIRIRTCVGEGLRQRLRNAAERLLPSSMPS